MEERYSESVEKLTFLVGITNPSCDPLICILSDNDSKTFEDCIIAAKIEAVDVEDDSKETMYFEELHY